MTDARIAKTRELQMLNDELRAQVAVLRNSLLSIKNQFVNYGGDTLLKDVWNIVDDGLAVSYRPDVAAQRANKLVEALESIKQSGTGTLDGTVVMTQEGRLAAETLAEWRGEK